MVGLLSPVWMVLVNMAVFFTVLTLPPKNTPWQSFWPLFGAIAIVLVDVTYVILLLVAYGEMWWGDIWDWCSRPGRKEW